MDLEDQSDRVVTAIMGLGRQDARHLVAVSGPPGAGKSTLADRVQQKLVRQNCPCGLVPMDGFHLDNGSLTRLGLLHRKGAPQTFDLANFKALLEQLLVVPVVDFPLFDRNHDRVLPKAARIVADQRLVIVEGNYLLLDSPGWRRLRSLWSFSVFLSPPAEDLRARLIQRWIDQGLSEDQATARAQQNDLVNAELVLSNSFPSDLHLAHFAQA